MNQTNKYSYFQSIGVFLAGCFLFTFLAMMEFAVASYLDRRKTNKRLMKLSRKGHNVDMECETATKFRRPTVAYLKDTMSGLRPATVDVYSRWFFPASFVTFFGVYWITLFFSLQDLPKDMIVFQRI